MSGRPVGSVGTCEVEASGCNKLLKIGSNATAKLIGWSQLQFPLKKLVQKTIEVLMSESVGNINSTGIDFTLSGLHDSVVSSLIATNGNQYYLSYDSKFD